MENCNVLYKDKSAETRTPLADIHEDTNAFYLTLDIPGVKEEELNVTYENGRVVITGNAQLDDIDGLERGYEEYKIRPFRRSFVVSDHVNPQGIKAVLRSGVLDLTLPKSESIKPRKIAISTEDSH